jgi:hypothetical protein
LKQLEQGYRWILKIDVKFFFFSKLKKKKSKEIVFFFLHPYALLLVVREQSENEENFRTDVMANEVDVTFTELDIPAETNNFSTSQLSTQSYHENFGTSFVANGESLINSSNLSAIMANESYLAQRDNNPQPISNSSAQMMSGNNPQNFGSEKESFQTFFSPSLKHIEHVSRLLSVEPKRLKLVDANGKITFQHILKKNENGDTLFWQICFFSEIFIQADGQAVKFSTNHTFQSCDHLLKFLFHSTRYVLDVSFCYEIWKIFHLLAVNEHNEWNEFILPQTFSSNDRKKFASSFFSIPLPFFLETLSFFRKSKKKRNFFIFIFFFTLFLLFFFIFFILYFILFVFFFIFHFIFFIFHFISFQLLFFF